MEKAKESKTIDKQDILKKLQSAKNDLEKLESTRESSLALSNLDNTIYWLNLVK